MRPFSNFTYRNGADARTPAGLGQLTLVSPIRIETSLPGTGSLLVVFGTLTLNFVPEPGTLVLLGAGAAALGLLGRGRLRRRSSSRRPPTPLRRAPSASCAARRPAVVGLAARRAHELRARTRRRRGTL